MEDSENLVNSHPYSNSDQDPQDSVNGKVTSDYDDDNIPEIDTPKISHPDDLVITSIEDDHAINFHQL